MTERRNRHLVVAIILLVVLLLPVIAYAYKICNTYSDGCTICDFYGSDGHYVGYIEWCN